MAHFHENWTKLHFEGTFWSLFAIYMPMGPRKKVPQMTQNQSIYLGDHPKILGKKTQKMRTAITPLCLVIVCQ